MNQLLALVRLELKLYFRDRRALILLFVVPIGIASFMGMLTSGMDGRSKGGTGGLQLLMTDLDDSATSRGVIRAFTNDSTFRVTVTNEAAARDLVLNGRRPVALVLPAGFGRDALPGLFDTNRKPVITLFHDPSRPMERQLVEGILVPKVMQAVAQNAFSLEGARGLIRDGLDRTPLSATASPRQKELLHELLLRSDEWLGTQTNLPGLRASDSSTSTNAFSIPLPFSTRAEALTRNEAVYNGYAHSFAGMGIQFILMAMIDLAVALLKDRDSGVFRRLRSTPLSRATLLAGKALAWTIIAFLSLAGCFAFAMIVFQVRIAGSLPGFVGVMAASALMAATLGLMLAGLGKTPAGTRGVAIAVILLVVMVGGAWFPSFVFPQWLQSVSLATPARWAVDGLDAMTWRGLGLGEALRAIGALLGFSAVFSAIAWSRFKWESA